MKTSPRKKLDTNMATTTPAKIFWRTLLGVFALAVLYFAGFFATLSVSARTQRSYPVILRIYEPIPFSWRMRMMQFWISVDRKIERIHQG